MTIREGLNHAIRQLQSVSESASLDAQILLAEVLGKNRAYVLAHGDDALTPEQQARFDGWIQRRAAGEPVAYILGRRAFYDREFAVAPGVLIPRPETELLLEAALEFAAHLPECAAADIGTGSGALAVTFAANVPAATVYAVDISRAALDVARRNTELHQVNVIFLQGNLLQPLIERGIKVDLLMANLPYIASGELSELEVSKHEPLLALDGGADGLDLIRRLLEDVPQVCNPGALILLEIGWDQGEKALALAQDLLSPTSIEILKDYAQLDRIVRVIL